MTPSIGPQLDPAGSPLRVAEPNAGGPPPDRAKYANALGGGTRGGSMLVSSL
jgi:hypothetical protein